MAKWIKVEITTTTEGIETVAAVLLEENLAYEVRDAYDFKRFLQKEYSHWDYIDDDLMELAHSPTVLTVYLVDEPYGVEQLSVITRELDRLKFMAYNNEWGELNYSLSSVDEEDWATSWKQYYHPIEISEKLVIMPQWQNDEKYNDRTVVKLDPGMAFGTGSHESTKLCLEMLDSIVKGEEKVLDVGCGSGILSIAAVMLGAKEAVGTDIDQLAVDIATKNAEVNNVGNKTKYKKGNFADGINEKFDIICANIVADAIMDFCKEVPSLLNPDGYFICSGIIDTRADEVADSLNLAGLETTEQKLEKGWVAFLCKVR